jgi:hypothetical protein
LGQPFTPISTGGEAKLLPFFLSPGCFKYVRHLSERTNV